MEFSLKFGNVEKKRKSRSNMFVTFQETLRANLEANIAFIESHRKIKNFIQI